MFDMLKNAMLTGVGLAALTREKVEELAHEWAKSAQLSNEKGREFVDEVLQRSEKARKDLQENIQKQVKEAIKHTSLATHDDIVKLSNRVKHLEQLLAEKSR